MRTKFNKLLILASAGALTGLVWADDAQIKAGKADAEIQSRSDLQADKTMRSQFQRASDLMGTDIVNQQNEKIGAVKDVMVDLQSGHAPFAVISSGGFFGVGDRLMAIPTSSFSQTSDESLSLNMDKQKLQAAPSFDRAAWPDMSDEAWSSEVYSYYGQQQPAASSSGSVATTTIINEPSGSDRYQSSSSLSGHSDSTSQEFGETTTGLHRDRTPRQGLGAADLTKNEQKIYNPGGYAASDSFIQSEASGAERYQTRSGTANRQSGREGWTKANTSSQQTGKVSRASDLIGMEVKNTQGERVGEIKDVVLDLQSGRVAYTVLSAAGYADMSDRLFAIPPAVFTRSTDERTLVLNTDKEMLKAAPSFEKNSWSESNNQQFTSEVYRYYKQPIYWQSSGAIREPSGTELRNNQNGQLEESDKWERGNNPKEESRPEVQDPSGAEPSQPQSDTSSDLNQNESAAPAAVEPERYQSPAPEADAALQPDQSSAAKETEELQAPTQGAAAEANQDAAQEAAGAATATTPATSDDQAGGNADRNMSERLRTEFKNDTDLSAKTENVQVSASNGRITLRGSVASEEEKKAIGMKAQTIAGSADKVDNQLRVTTEPSTP